MKWSKGAVIAAAMLAGNAFASDFYVGAKFSQVKSDDWCDLVDFEASIFWDEEITDRLSWTCDSTATNVQIEAGWQINSYVAIESAYLPETDLKGSVDVSYFDGDFLYDESLTGSIESLRFSGVAVWPVSDWVQLKGKAGIFGWKSNFAWDLDISGVRNLSFNDNYENNGISVVFGVSAEVRFSPNWSVTLDVENFKDVELLYEFYYEDENGVRHVDELSFEGDITMTSIGMHYTF